MDPASTPAEPKTSIGRRFRPLLIGGVVAFIIMEIVALSPASFEDAPTESSVSEDTLLPKAEVGILATGIPKGKVPEYSVDGFHYVSVVGGQKQWKLVAEKANLYNVEKLVHARIVTAYLYDSDDKVTIVQGLEAKYFMNKQDLEVFGSVKTTFPDGFQTNSEYLRYNPSTKKVVIPVQYFVTGHGAEGEQQKMEFESHGLDFAMAASHVILQQKVKVVMTKKPPASPDATDTAAGVPAVTTIQSDHCEIERTIQLAHFSMNDGDSDQKRFVLINQPGMYARSRRADLNYGDFSQVLQYMTAYEDVFIQELPKAALPNSPLPKPGENPSLRYGTGGRADFDTHKNLVILKEFPQVYQDNDTVTGDIITVHRDTDIVEVEHSNAYSEGGDQPAQQKPVEPKPVGQRH